MREMRENDVATNLRHRSFGLVVVVSILFQIKKDTLMIGHCTAWAVIATKALRGKQIKPEHDKGEKHCTSHAGVITSRVSLLYLCFRFHNWLTLLKTRLQERSLLASCRLGLSIHLVVHCRRHLLSSSSQCGRHQLPQVMVPRREICSVARGVPATALSWVPEQCIPWPSSLLPACWPLHS